MDTATVLFSRDASAQILDLSTGTALATLSRVAVKPNGCSPATLISYSYSSFSSSSSSSSSTATNTTLSSNANSSLFLYSASGSTLTCHALHTPEPLWKSSLSERISALACSHSGELLLAGTESGRLLAYATTTGMLLASLEIHGGAILSIAVDDDDATVATSSADCRVYLAPLASLLAPESGRGSYLEYHTMPVHHVALGLGRLLSMSSGVVALHSVPALALLCACTTGGSGAKSCFYDPVTAVVGVGTADGQIALVQLQALPMTASHNEFPLRDVATFHPAHAGAVTALGRTMLGSRLVSAGADGCVKTWQLPDMASVSAFDCHNGEISALFVRADADPAVRPADKAHMPAPIKKFTAVDTNDAEALVGLGGNHMRELEAMLRQLEGLGREAADLEGMMGADGYLGEDDEEGEEDEVDEEEGETDDVAVLKRRLESARDEARASHDMNVALYKECVQEILDALRQAK